MDEGCSSERWKKGGFGEVSIRKKPEFLVTQVTDENGLRGAKAGEGKESVTHSPGVHKDNILDTADRRLQGPTEEDKQTQDGDSESRQLQDVIMCALVQEVRQDVEQPRGSVLGIDKGNEIATKEVSGQWRCGG